MTTQAPSKEQTKRWRVSPGDARYVFAPDLSAPINMQSKFRAAWLVEAANARIDQQNAALRAAPEPRTDFGVTPTLAAVRMAINTYDHDRDERRVLEEIRETVRHALPPVPALSVMDREVTVCSACERACCWQGEFMCDHAEMAWTKQFTVRDLSAKPRGENPEYWFKDCSTGAIDVATLKEYYEVDKGPTATKGGGQ